jgi:branched-subunit amino acid aminotransferase/4-amino-4-deoxychorismate lyase
MSIIYLNGRFVDQMDAGLDPLDRGVLLGDGVFETIRCEEGQLLFHVAHLARLARNARLVEIPWNQNPEHLLEICHQALDANGLKRGRLRITLTRGELAGSPEIRDAMTAPTLIVSTAPIDQEAIDAVRKRGWQATVVTFPINHRSPLAQVKSTSYQERLLARRQATRNGYDEGLMLNTDGLLAEGVMTNLFLVKGNRLVTPPVEDGALPGVVRLKVGLIASRIGMEYVEESITVQDLMEADEAFMTNAVLEIIPLVKVDGRPIAAGTPGEKTARLYSEHRRDVEMFLHTMRHG